MSYYSQKQYLALVDKEDNIVGQAEKWETHKKGLLHRGFTVILTYKNNVVLQHRKHPVFNRVYDLSFSSHPVYIKNRLQPNLIAIHEALVREWGVKNKDLVKGPKLLGKFYYQAKDKKSGYIENEIDYIFSAELKYPPTPNLEFAYNFSLINKKNLSSSIRPLSAKLAPWVKEIFKNKINL